MGRLVLWEDLTIPELQFTETQVISKYKNGAASFKVTPLLFIIFFNKQDDKPGYVVE